MQISEATSDVKHDTKLFRNSREYTFSNQYMMEGDLLLCTKLAARHSECNRRGRH